MRALKRLHLHTLPRKGSVSPSTSSLHPLASVAAVDSSVAGSDPTSVAPPEFLCISSPERQATSSNEQQSSSEQRATSSDEQQSSSERQATSSDKQHSPRASVCSPQSFAWSRKRLQKAKIAAVRPAMLSASADGPSVETGGPSMDADRSYRSEEERGDDFSSTDEAFNPQDTFDEWMVSLRLDQRKMLAVILMESFKRRQKMRVKDAASEAGSIVGFNERTVRKYRNDFFSNDGRFSIRQQGRYERHCVHHNEELNIKAATWVREHAFIKGKPNMTAESFCVWVNNELLMSSHLPPNFPRTISTDCHTLAAPSWL